MSNYGVARCTGSPVGVDCQRFGRAAAGAVEWDVQRLAASLVIAGRDNDVTAQHRRVYDRHGSA
ncbi:DUF2252 family protein [Nocardia salmonicida]|uniref:DUF2252 family protein n=1 Tax=Nocardia salmonicida TaxID=53431 RepID=UPI00379A5E4E